jgi:hypothetical protein
VKRIGKAFSDLEELVGTMLAKSPDDRYQSMTEVAETLMYRCRKEGGTGVGREIGIGC